MNKKQFADKYCTKCGTQRCEGVDSEWVDGCGHWKKEMGGLNLVEKAMDNKGIMILGADIQKDGITYSDGTTMDNKGIGEITKRSPPKCVFDASDKFLMYLGNQEKVYSFMYKNYFESMNEEVEC